MFEAAEWEALVAAFLATPYHRLRLTLPEGVMEFVREEGGQVTMHRRLASDEGEAAATEERREDDPRLVRAPMSGTFYRAPRPGAPPFVEEGHVVGAETVVGIIEAMKLMNAIAAGKTGKIAAFLVDDATFVSEGTPLLRLDLP